MKEEWVHQRLPAAAYLFVSTIVLELFSLVKAFKGRRAYGRVSLPQAASMKRCKTVQNQDAG